MPEEYTPKFLGNWVRSEIFDMVYQRTVSLKEAWLLLQIDNLVDRTGQDCYASNAWFAQRMNVRESRIDRMVSNLRKIGLVETTTKATQNGKKRLMKTCWSRMTPFPNQESSQSSCQGKKDTCQGSSQSTCQEDCYNKEENSKKNKNSAANSGSAARHPRWMAFAVKLANVVKQVRGMDCHALEAWATAIRKIHTRDGVDIPRLRSILDWYCATLIKEGDLIANKNPNFIPIAFGGGPFRSKFLRIEEAMQRQSSKSSLAEEEESIVLSPRQEENHKNFLKTLRASGAPRAQGSRELIYRLGLLTTRAVKRCKEVIEEGGDAAGSPTHSIIQARAMREIVLPQMFGQYLSWIVRQVTEWEGWEGKLNGFFPGGKHHGRYAEMILRNHTYQWTKEFRGLLLDAT